MKIHWSLCIALTTVEKQMWEATLHKNFTLSVHFINDLVWHSLVNILNALSTSTQLISLTTPWDECIDNSYFTDM